jgi:hypothetical protein
MMSGGRAAKGGIACLQYDGEVTQYHVHTDDVVVCSIDAELEAVLEVANVAKEEVVV